MTERQDGARPVPARLEIFGFAPTPADVLVIPRDKSWRVSHALGALAIIWGLTPVVALIPPHIPWAVAGAVLGPFYARRYATQRYTLVQMHGTCPSCGAALASDKKVKLRFPHPFTCEQCHHSALLETDVSSPTSY